ncbi:thiolase family protein [Sphingomonas solaris]|uniref:Thiolase family protein n=1 Tax=Alterirhizorhabdus solaris TaxID=2529389 RepID=A0A558RBL1_9SPHN|nr:thiolase family protein [Sphingomonas solaris]TVV76652.1 thiolase family protein [Sphingomonas solaris]
MKRGAVAIVGMGVTEQRRGIGARPLELRRQALEYALADAGIGRDAIDGYIHASHEREDLRYLGLSPNFSWPVQSGGATAPCSFVMAAGAILSGQAEMVACAYGMAPSSGGMPGMGEKMSFGALGYGYPAQVGMIGAASAHALHARWHMDRYGTTSRHLGAVAVQLRDHAVGRPDAITFGQPITIEDHQASPMVVDPFRMLDCCRDTDGGAVFLLTTAERARTMAGTRPVYLLGAGMGHNIGNWHRRDVYPHHDDIAPAKARAFAQAGLTLADIDTAQFYDPFTISIIMQLEQYGFCAPGHGGPFVADGGIGLSGRIPSNTGGGQISGFYAAGFTPLIEAIRQLRDEAGTTQVKGARFALTSGHGLNGGVQNTWSHGTLILGADA